jgi:hypothetical protein
MLREIVPWDVTTFIFPLVAPTGTVVLISVSETTVKAAAVPLKLTLVEALNPFPNTTAIVVSTEFAYAVKVTVPALNEFRNRRRTVGLVKSQNGGERLC